MHFPVQSMEWISIPASLNFLHNERRYVLSYMRRSRRQRDVCGDFVNLEDLPAQSSKMLIRVGFAYVCS